MWKSKKNNSINVTVRGNTIYISGSLPKKEGEKKTLAEQIRDGLSKNPDVNRLDFSEVKVTKEELKNYIVDNRSIFHDNNITVVIVPLEIHRDQEFTTFINQGSQQKFDIFHSGIWKFSEHDLKELKKKKNKEEIQKFLGDITTIDLRNLNNLKWDDISPDWAMVNVIVPTQLSKNKESFEHYTTQLWNSSGLSIYSDTNSPESASSNSAPCLLPTSNPKNKGNEYDKKGEFKSQSSDQIPTSKEAPVIRTDSNSSKSKVPNNTHESQKGVENPEGGDDNQSILNNSKKNSLKPPLKGRNSNSENDLQKFNFNDDVPANDGLKSGSLDGDNSNVLETEQKPPVQRNKKPAL